MDDNDQFDEVSFQTLWADPEVDVLTAAAASVRDTEPQPAWIHRLGLFVAIVAMLVVFWLLS